MHTKQAETDRYESVWSAVGEGEDQVGRLVILDDGNYHYAVTVMAPAETAGELTKTWQKLLNSAVISTD
jgi:VCBS repeat-containing protein